MTVHDSAETLLALLGHDAQSAAEQFADDCDRMGLADEAIYWRSVAANLFVLQSVQPLIANDIGNGPTR